jgi:hypothetical protein
MLLFFCSFRVEKYANLPAEELASSQPQGVCPVAVQAPSSSFSDSAPVAAPGQCPRDASSPAASLLEDMDMDAMLQALEELEETRRRY